MLKLTIPTEANLYKDLAEHPNVVRIVVLSGGYSREKANELLKDNAELIASFSRALASDLRAGQSKEEFDKALGDAVESIYDASVNKTNLYIKRIFDINYKRTHTCALKALCMSLLIKVDFAVCIIDYAKNRTAENL